MPAERPFMPDWAILECRVCGAPWGMDGKPTCTHLGDRFDRAWARITHRIRRATNAR